MQRRATAKRYTDGQGLDYQYENTTSRLKTRSDALSQQTRYRYAKDNAPLEIAYTTDWQHDWGSRQSVESNG